MAVMNLETQIKFDTFFQGCKDVRDAYWERMDFTHEKDVFSYKVGRRYVKITCGYSVHTFVDMTNGDVLKPAGHSKPAKHARGNIYDKDNGLKGMTPHGPYYL